MKISRGKLLPIH